MVSGRETDRYHFFETDIDIFNFFTDNWLAADIRMATYTDTPKFACRYINKVFWLKLLRIAYGNLTNEVN